MYRNKYIIFPFTILLPRVYLDLLIGNFVRMSKNTWIAVAVSVFVVGFFFLGGMFSGLFQTGDRANSEVQLNEIIMNESTRQEASLLMEDLVVGSGEEATAGSLVTVHYTGTLESGEKFDSSLDRGAPFQFILGVGQVISGWDQGVSGMKVGGKRKLTIPPELGYGANAVGSIPANSTLFFEVELLEVQPLQ